MKEKISGLSIKLITSVLLLSVLLCAAISYMGYREFTTVLEDEYNRSAYEIAETAKSYLDPDRLEHYLETGEIDAAYLEIQDRLDALVVSTNSYLIYVTRLSNDYTTSTYIFDAVHPDSGFTRYALGYTAQDMDPAYQDEVEQIMTTGERSAVYFYSYTQASGAHTTAGIPVKDSAGEIVAFLGVEKAMTALENARQTYVWNVMGITVLAVVLFLVVYIGFLRREVVSPILTMPERPGALPRTMWPGWTCWSRSGRRTRSARWPAPSAGWRRTSCSTWKTSLPSPRRRSASAQS